MKRAALLIVAALGWVVDSRADVRSISITGASAGATYEIGLAPVGSMPSSSIFSGTLAPNETAQTLRDRMVPPAGIAGLGKRSGGSDIAVFFGSEEYQYWVDDGTGWMVLAENEPVTTPNGLTFKDQRSNFSGCPNSYAVGKFITLGAITSPIGATWQLGVAPIGSSTITPVLSGFLGPGESPDLLRDRMMPEEGVDGFGKRAGSLGQKAFRLFVEDTVQVWASPDGVDWYVLSENGAGYNHNPPLPFSDRTLASAGVFPPGRYLQTGGDFSLSAATYYVGVAPVGSDDVTPILSGSLAWGEEGRFLAYRMVPPAGIAGVGKRAGDSSDIRLFYPDDIQFWVSTDALNWSVVSGYGTSTIVNGIGFYERGIENDTPPGGTVPAVGAWGLLVLGLSVVAAGSLVVRARYTGLSNR